MAFFKNYRINLSNQPLINEYLKYNGIMDRKKITMMRKNKSTGIYEYLDEDNEEIYFNSKNNFRTHTICNKCSLCLFDKQFDHSIKECLNQFLIEKEKIKKLNKKICIHKCGIIGEMFYKWIELHHEYINKFTFETVSNELEYKFIQNCDLSAIYYCKDHTFHKELHCFDINSNHCNIMMTNKFPYKQGQFMKIKNINKDDIKYGIYNCKIYVKNNLYMKKMIKIFTLI